MNTSILSRYYYKLYELNLNWIYFAQSSQLSSRSISTWNFNICAIKLQAYWDETFASQSLSMFNLIEFYVLIKTSVQQVKWMNYRMSATWIERLHVVSCMFNVHGICRINDRLSTKQTVAMYSCSIKSIRFFCSFFIK